MDLVRSTIKDTFLLLFPGYVLEQNVTLDQKRADLWHILLRVTKRWGRRTNLGSALGGRRKGVFN